MSNSSAAQNVRTGWGKAVGNIALATVLMVFILPAAPVNSLALSVGAVAVGGLAGGVIPIAIAQFPEPHREATVRAVVFGGLGVFGLVVGFGSLLLLPNTASYAFLHGALAFLWAYALTELVLVWV